LPESLKKLGVNQKYGYINVNATYGANLFYWFFESQAPATPNTPVVLWLTGGPGCSSELALFFENGPWTVNSDLSLKTNPYSWNKNAHLLYVDNPAGTGFSYVTNQNGYVSNERQVARELWVFLQKFFTKYPQYSKLPFWVTGESYGGHYVPAISTEILKKNLNNTGLHINMKGLAIGNGWIDPLIQTGSYAPFAFAHNLIGQSTVDQANAQYQQCVQDIQNQDYADAFNDCNQVFGIVLQAAGNINYYDIRKQCNPQPLCYDMSSITNYLNQQSVQQSLNVNKVWEACSGTVYQYFENYDMEKSYRFEIPELLKYYKVLFYNGKDDLICNFYGTSSLLKTMSWPGQQGFQNAANTTWTVNGVHAGEYRTYQNLAFLTVSQAGHMVPHDQPQNALLLLNNFIFNKKFADQKQ